MNAITWVTVGALGLAGLFWGRIVWGAWRLRALPALGHPPYPGPSIGTRPKVHLP